MPRRDNAFTTDEALADSHSNVIQKNWSKYLKAHPGVQVTLGMGPKNAVYTSFTTMWRTALTHLITAPHYESRDGGCREIIGYHACLHPSAIPWVYSANREASAQYAMGELCWYMSGSDQVTGFMDQYAPSYKRFAYDDGKTPGAYGPRITAAMPHVIEELKKNPNSRRAVINLYSHDFLAWENMKDVPCTETLQFMIRNGCLHCVVNMRSNDVWVGMVYDVFCFATIQRFLAAELGVGVGCYIHSVGSLHLYDRHYEKAKQELESPVLARGIVARRDYERVCAFSTPGPMDTWSIASKKLTRAEQYLRMAYMYASDEADRKSRLEQVTQSVCQVNNYDKAPLTSILMEALVHYWCDWTLPPLMFPNPKRYKDVHRSK